MLLNRFSQVTNLSQRFPIDFHRYRSLQELDIHYRSPMVGLANERTAQALETAVLDAHLLASAQIGPRFDAASGFHHGQDRGDFGVRYRRGCFCEPNDRGYRRCSQNQQAVLIRKPAEDIAGEEAQFDFLDPVGPAAACAIDW